MIEETVVYDFEQDAAAYLNAVATAQILEITEGTFYYFLEVLPPAYMGRTITINNRPRRVTFGFAEGCEPITAFWAEKKDGRVRYFCKRTDEMNRS